ncbi:MAG: hypothetical protein ACRENB_02760 [Gemmatimonadales bacterium]
MIRPALALVLAVVAACDAAAADHERLGDRAYGEGRYGTAVAEFRAAVRSGGRPRLWAKLGAAALRNREPGTAVMAYERLGVEDATRAAEAAVGLERAAFLAEREGTAGTAHLVAAVRALRRVSTGRPLGRFALAPTPELAGPEALAVFPAALASAGEGRPVDSLLVAWGSAQRLLTACDAATRTFRTALRRVRDPALRRRAQSGLVDCALRLGLDALAAKRGEMAEEWFDVAATGAPGSPASWRARLGKGDARMLQGDLLGAALAWQEILSASGVPDSLTKSAAAKLNALAGAGSPPSLEAR